MSWKLAVMKVFTVISDGDKDIIHHGNITVVRNIAVIPVYIVVIYVICSVLCAVYTVVRSKMYEVSTCFMNSLAVLCIVGRGVGLPGRIVG